MATKTSTEVKTATVGQHKVRLGHDVNGRIVSETFYQGETRIYIGIPSPNAVRNGWISQCTECGHDCIVAVVRINGKPFCGWHIPFRWAQVVDVSLDFLLREHEKSDGMISRM